LGIRAPRSVLFSDMDHGWVSRGDYRRDPRVDAEQKRAVREAVRWTREVTRSS